MKQSPFLFRFPRGGIPMQLTKALHSQERKRAAIVPKTSGATGIILTLPFFGAVRPPNFFEKKERRTNRENK
jgi:hypothetical protein